MKQPLWVNLAFPLAVKKECIWKVLTVPSMTHQNWCNCLLQNTYLMGNIIDCTSTNQKGTHRTFMRSELLEYSPCECMRFKIYHQRIGKKYHSELRFKIIPITKGILLNIKQGDFTHFPEAEKIFKTSLGAWQSFQENLIKTCRPLS